MFAPAAVRVPFHSWLMVWPLPNVQATRQPVRAEAPVFRTATSVWKPPLHWPVTVYVAAQALPPPVAVGVGVGDLLAVGVTLGVTLGDAVAVGPAVAAGGAGGR